MARPRTYKTEAVVLRQMSLGEADRILTLYTTDLGKVRAVARGVRRVNSRIRGHLELLNQVSISLSHGRELDVVTEVQIVQSFRGLREDLPRLSRALYVAELVDGFSVERASGHEVYVLLLDALGWLERTAHADLLLRYFEIHLLDESGYRPELYSCVECRTTLEPDHHLFSCAAGGILCPDCRGAAGDAMVPISLNAMKVLRFLLREREYARVEGLKVSAGLVREIERLLRVYIRFLVERELKSAAFVNLVSFE
jgi:DNA repair protein RecO (recombination protein O)